jgi:hypothetical protein
MHTCLLMRRLRTWTPVLQGCSFGRAGSLIKHRTGSSADRCRFHESWGMKPGPKPPPPLLSPHSIFGPDIIPLDSHEATDSIDDASAQQTQMEKHVMNAREGPRVSTERN